MAFCKNCGTAQNEGATVCPNCGEYVGPMPQDNQPSFQPGQTGYVQQPIFVQPQPIVYARPQIPGRGFGISAMVLGIIGLFYSFILLIGGMAYASSFHYGNVGIGFVFAILMYSSLSILAVVFGVASKKRGYINGISSSGLIMGVIGLVFWFIAAILFMVG